jgi:hypothetical protein
MNRNKNAIFYFLIMAITSSASFLSSCSDDIKEGSVIFTQTQDKTQNTNNLTLNSWRYNLQSQIAVIEPGKPEQQAKVITPDFYSALSPKISFDGKYILFSGKKQENDSWQIWEMNLSNSEIRQVTKAEGNCTDPAYLPLGRIVFSSFLSGNKEKSPSLYTCNVDGTNLQKITYNPYSYTLSSVMKDGRIVSLTQQTEETGDETMLMVLRPDGTKNEIFYTGTSGRLQVSATSETATGKLMFIESEKDNPSIGKLVSVSYNRPLHSHTDYSSEIKGSFQSVSSLNSGKILVSYSPAEGEKYAVYEFDPERKTMGKEVYKSADFDVNEAVIVEKRERPKKLPSEVDSGVKTGLLMCQDINFTGILSDGKTGSVMGADRVEIIGQDSSFGIVQAETDGSVYLKIIADTPFRLRTLDDKGNILNETCDWIYLRPNERRGCIGCHEDHEMVPENKLPLAVRKAPALVPVHKTKLKEKAIELE